MTGEMPYGVTPIAKLAAFTNGHNQCDILIVVSEPDEHDDAEYCNVICHSREGDAMRSLQGFTTAEKLELWMPVAQAIEWCVSNNYSLLIGNEFFSVYQYDHRYTATTELLP